MIIFSSDTDFPFEDFPATEWDTLFPKVDPTTKGVPTDAEGEE